MFGLGSLLIALRRPATIPPPTLDTVTPAIVDRRGSTVPRYCSGTNFNGATTVTVDGVSVPFTLISDTSLRIDSLPAHVAGSVSVVITTPGGSNLANTALEYWDLGVDGPALHYTKPDYSRVSGTGTYVARAGNNLVESSFAPPATNGVPDFATNAHILSASPAVPVSTWAGVGNHHFVVVVAFDTMTGANGTSITYNNPRVFLDTAQFIGVTTRVSGGRYYLDYYEFDVATAKVASWDLGTSVPAGPIVVQAKKTGGAIYIKVGSGAWSAPTACGNVGGAATGNFTMGSNIDGRVYAFASYAGSAKNDAFAAKAAAYAAAEFGAAA